MRWPCSMPGELSRWGIETSIIVPGAFTGGANHFAHSGAPADTARVAEYEAGPYAGFAKQVRIEFAAIVPPDADVSAVADAIVDVVDAPFGKRPFRVHIDPTQDGADVTFAVIDRMFRAEMLVASASVISWFLLRTRSVRPPSSRCGCDAAGWRIAP